MSPTTSLFQVGLHAAACAREVGQQATEQVAVAAPSSTCTARISGETCTRLQYTIQAVSTCGSRFGREKNALK